MTKAITYLKVFSLWLNRTIINGFKTLPIELVPLKIAKIVLISRISTTK